MMENIGNLLSFSSVTFIRGEVDLRMSGFWSGNCRNILLLFKCQLSALKIMSISAP